MNLLAAETYLLAAGWTRHTPAAPTTGPIFISADGKTSIGLRQIPTPDGTDALHATGYMGQRYAHAVYGDVDSGAKLLSDAFLTDPAERTPDDLANLEREMAQ